MNSARTELPGVIVVDPLVHPDARGDFFESYHARRYAEHGITTRFVQDNHSRSIPGTLRGLHYQLRHPQGKLVRCVRGGVLDVAVDIRQGSPTFAQWVGVELTAENKRQLYIPPGFAHGFCAPEQESEVEYKCTDYYVPDDQHGVIWNDATIGIHWTVDQPRVSDRDAQYLPIDADRDDLPPYEP